MQKEIDDITEDFRCIGNPRIWATLHAVGSRRYRQSHNLPLTDDPDDPDWLRFDKYDRKELYRCLVSNQKVEERRREMTNKQYTQQRLSNV